MTFKNSWLIFFVMSLLLMLLSLSYIFWGHSLEPKANLVVKEIAIFSQKDGDFVKQILRVFGLSWFTWGFLSAVISFTAFKRGEIWAWYAFWIMPIYEIGDGWIDLAAGGTTGWIPMIIAAFLIAILLLSPQSKIIFTKK